GVYKLEDLKVGMQMPGIVTNVTNFGAFVDIGVHQDGLVHISHLSDKFIKDPKEAVAVQQKVKVTVVEVDIERKRIGLSMKTNPFAEPQPEAKPNAHRDKPKGHHAPKRQEAKPAKPREPELSMEEKLALLKNKFKK
ncbi:MAG: S1 RNA-binding domain-containing protein, partial [Bacteroidota bacterium]